MRYHGVHKWCKRRFVYFVSSGTIAHVTYISSFLLSPTLFHSLPLSPTIFHSLPLSPTPLLLRHAGPSARHRARGTPAQAVRAPTRVRPAGQSHTPALSKVRRARAQVGRGAYLQLVPSDDWRGRLQLLPVQQLVRTTPHTNAHLHINSSTRSLLDAQSQPPACSFTRQLLHGHICVHTRPQTPHPPTAAAS
jgi:hypothetical protein